MSCRQTFQGLNGRRNRRLTPESVAFIGILIHDRFTSAISYGDSLDRTRRQRKRIPSRNGRTLSRVEGRENSDGGGRYIRISLGPSLIIIARHAGPPRISIGSLPLPLLARLSYHRFESLSLALLSPAGFKDIY